MDEPVKTILQSLHRIQSHAGSPSAIVYVDQILQIINELDDLAADDPLLEVLFALYDALAFNGLWVTYTSTQYKQAERLLVKVMKQPITQKKVEKTIVDLERIGFEITPYALTSPVK